MEFKLILVPETPDKLLLHAEKPLAGLEFIEEASKCLRRSLDTKTVMRHLTMGNVAKYTILVPQALAIESKRFAKSSEFYLVCEENILEKYIFHGASASTAPGCRAVYPYYNDEIVLSSYIDELAFLNTWRSRGYQRSMTINLKGDGGISLPLVPDVDDVEGPACGDMVLDDMLRGVR